MSAPTLLDIKRFNSALHGIPLSDGWRIPSSKSDDVIWNIVLAYLNSFPPWNKKKLSQRIKCLAGRQTVNENIKNSLEICNPFLHRNACFCDEAMSALVAVFKERVKDYIKNNSALLRLMNENFIYLEASSKLLSCNIAVISLSFQNETIVNIFPLSYFPNLPTVYPKNIVLFYEVIFSRRKRNLQLKFSFCVPKEIGMQKQKQALAEILQRATVPDRKIKMIQKICRLPDVSNNFIISLLKNDFVQIIPFIYKSPYVLSKLADAGFETDPRTKDSTGKSAFFHALKTEESQLVSLLYDHAANACLQTDASVRSPDPVIVENLLCLKDYLKLLEKDLESEEISEKSRCLFRDLCRFNEFQIEICKNINNIRLRINYYDQTEKEYEASQRKETILIILKIYETYFDYTGREAEQSVGADYNISRFKEFYKHRDYFDKLDFCSAVMFFDNLFLLKERVKVPNNAYLDIESKFFLFIFCRKYLERYEKEKYFYFVSRWITFQERWSLQGQLCSFKKILENTELSKDNIVGKLPEAVVRTLTNLPQIYGQFLIFRLQRYLNAATGLVVKDLKSILVIERCLQVMGECCKESYFNSVQRIVSLALPKDFIKYLKQIRNHLTHIKPYELLYRNNLEQDVELFKGIQNELAKLKRLLVPIYSAHKYELDQFLLLHSVKSICKARRRSILEVHENQLKAILPSPEMEETHLSAPTYSSQKPWKRYFDDMHTSLKKEINDLNCNGSFLDKNSVSHYKKIMQNMVSAIGEVLKNLKVAIPVKVVELESHFWCLENILTYITKDRKLAKYRRTLILMIEERKSFFNGLKENENQFQKINKPTYSVTDGITVAEVGKVEKQQSSQLEETGSNCQQEVNPINNFIKFGVLFNTESGSSTFVNENEDNRPSHKTSECLETKQVEDEINGENFENYVLQNMFHDSTSQEATDTKERKEVVDLYENSEDPQQVILIEENYLPFSEAISMSSRDDWLLANVFNIYHDYPGPAEMIDVQRKRKKSSEFNIFVEHAAKFLDRYEAIANKIFQKIPKKKERIVEFHSGSIEKYCFILKGWTVLKNKEKDFIVRSVPKQFQNVPKLKRRVKGLLRSKTEFTKEIEVELSKLNLKNKEIKEIKENIKFGIIDDATLIVDSARDYFSELKVMMESKEIDKKECELLCKKLELPDKAKDLLMKLLPGQNKKVPGNQFEFLRNRIKILKNILIEETNAIQQLWERATTPRRKMHVKEKVIQLYLNNSEIQASVETLLFDCMAILSSKELKKLWKKTTNLFNGINLRNVLAHGHPLLESLGRLLDPYDLPSELVERMLTLISDEYAMDCMQQILEQSGTDFSGFMTIMNDEDNEQFKNLREQILECDQWKEYALLIPLGEVRCV
ncbi:hypothetical protein AVEN_224109-1 [Araneus ventricosus]|uniref:Uncharacterized protein n=1 Tax=Araneus ventricosus TaxID=182803 RepID=A0A4Y2DVE7_ARAVE|nr:hypothetical protein AVEN_224109-1 [Araneus ventricosus]